MIPLEVLSKGLILEASEIRRLVYGHLRPCCNDLPSIRQWHLFRKSVLGGDLEAIEKFLAAGVSKRTGDAWRVRIPRDGSNDMKLHEWISFYFIETVRTAADAGMLVRNSRLGLHLEQALPALVPFERVKQAVLRETLCELIDRAILLKEGITITRTYFPNQTMEVVVL